MPSLSSHSQTEQRVRCHTFWNRATSPTRAPSPPGNLAFTALLSQNRKAKMDNNLRAELINSVQDSVWFVETYQEGFLTEDEHSAPVKDLVWIGIGQKGHQENEINHRSQSNQASSIVTEVPAILLGPNPKEKFSRLPNMAPEKFFVRL